MGFFQFDTKEYYTVVLTDPPVMDPNIGGNIIPKPLYLVASAKGANIRTSIPSGTPAFVPAGAKMKVEELIPGFQSDGYQWVKASYNKTSGYVQVDLNNWHYFQI